MSPQNSQAALAALNGVRPILSHFEKPRTAEDLAADIIDLWAGAESALQALVGNSSLGGQQLVRAARQAEVITIDQAHPLLEFLAARDRANRTSYKPTQADGDAAVDGFKALESGLKSGLTGSPPVKAAAPAPPSPVAYTPRHSRPAQPAKPPPPPQPASPYAPPSAGGGYRQPPAYAARSMAGPPTIEMPGSFSSEPSTGGGGSTGKGGSAARSGSSSGGASGGIGRTMVQQALAAADSGGRGFPWLPMPVWIGIAVILLAGGGYFFFGRGTSSGGLTAGIDAMQNGKREVARGIFAKAVNDDPSAPTPHIFLARLARGEGDLATARAQLDTALRLDPKNAVALREMGLVLFASRQYDLARRFFVRAVQANPQDRASQGYLGCAMMRLNRVAEGTKWISGAGTGLWQACLQPTTPTAAPPPL
ncbi:MAG TPA: tetratricopeptide repeat protein [Gemmatimonadaceae bacterium]